MSLGKEELMDIVYGSGFFGGGGGGAIEEGLSLLASLSAEEQQLELVDIKDMEDDPSIVSVMVAALGSPIATKGKSFSDEAINAINGMKDEAKAQGKNLKYIYSGEQGGGNTMLPLYAAIKLGMPVLDVDANGRAVPELNTGLLPIHDIPTSPVVLASSKGDVIVARTKDPLDSGACEAIARQMCMAYDMGIGFSAWLMDKKQHLAASALGQMTLTKKVGRVLRTATEQTLLDELIKCFGHFGIYTFLKSGTITKIELNTEGGFDNGVTTIEDEAGRVFTILFQNENLVLFNPAGKALTTVPDIITLVDIGKGAPWCPLSNSETEVGQKVMVLSVRADSRWEDEGGYECWDEVLKSAGYSMAKPKVTL